MSNHVIGLVKTLVGGQPTFERAALRPYLRTLREAAVLNESAIGQAARESNRPVDCLASGQIRALSADGLQAYAKMSMPATMRDDARAAVNAARTLSRNSATFTLTMRDGLMGGGLLLLSVAGLAPAAAIGVAAAGLFYLGRAALDISRLPRNAKGAEHLQQTWTERAQSLLQGTRDMGQDTEAGRHTRTEALDLRQVLLQRMRIAHALDGAGPVPLASIFATQSHWLGVPQ